MTHAMAVPRSMLHVLRDQAARLGERPALWTRRDGRFRPTSWREYESRVLQLAFALERLGFGRGSALAILSFNREEWLLADLAAMALGGVAVGLYTTSSPEQIQFVLAHCEAEIVVVENARHEVTVQALRTSLPKLREVIVLEGTAPGARTFDEVLALGRDVDAGWWSRKLDALEPDALATLIYTSGTTGNPKGVMLSHHNICWTAVHLSRAAEIDGSDTIISYLPLSHIAEQACSIYGPLLNGMQVYFADSLDTVAATIAEVRPTVFFGVPRVWEKFKAKAEEGIRRQRPVRQRLVAWARSVAFDRNARVLRHERVPARVGLKYALARRLVFGKLKAKIGFDRTRLFATSAAPIGRDVLDFFLSLDIVLREVYGQSEVTGPTSVNTPGWTRLGTVGRPMTGVEVKISDEGEVLVRGGNVCRGYFKDPAATAELIHDGWLHSGDLGALDGEGFLRITGRKKEIIVTSGGKKTAPTNIEAMLKELGPVGNAMVVGEGRNYLVALLPLDPEKVPDFARSQGFPSDPEALVAHPGFRQWVHARIEEQVNPRLSRFENVRKFELLPRDFTPETGELTPTLKLRRKVVEQKYAGVIAALYAPAGNEERGEAGGRSAS